MKTASLIRIIVGCLIAGITIYATVEATVYFIVNYTSMDYPVEASNLSLFLFRLIPGATFVLLYWWTGGLIAVEIGRASWTERV